MNLNSFHWIIPLNQANSYLQFMSWKSLKRSSHRGSSKQGREAAWSFSSCWSTTMIYIMIPKLPLKKYFLGRYFQFFPKMFQICRVKEGVVEVIETLQLGGGSGFAESQLQLGNARYLVMPSFLLSFSRATAKYGSGNLINICHHHPVGSTLSTALVYT